MRASSSAALVLALAACSPASPPAEPAASTPEPAPAAAPAPAAGPTLTVAWTTHRFANPESVLPSADGTFFYVSNVAGEGADKDGNGFISRLAIDGTLLEREWSKDDLDAPKGLALADGRLYVSDVTQLVVLDAASGEVLERFEAPDAKFLNDVAIAPDGAVLVSDSGSARIYALRDGKLETWHEGELFGAINGLLPEADRLIVTTMQGRLLAVDWTTREITPLATDLGNADGVVALDDGTWLVGEWPGRLFHVRADGTNTTLIDSREQKTYLNDFLRVGDRVIVPNWEPSTVTAYTLAQ